MRRNIQVTKKGEGAISCAVSPLALSSCVTFKGRTSALPSILRIGKISNLWINKQKTKAQLCSF